MQPRKAVLYYEAVRRAPAVSLILAIFYSLIAPALFADPESNLPECCRRKGSHQCSMSAQDAASTSGTEFRAIQRCPVFPAATAIPPGATVAVLRNCSAIFAGLVSHPTIQPQAEAHYRVSFSRSRQKRGPPTVRS